MSSIIPNDEQTAQHIAVATGTTVVDAAKLLRALNACRLLVEAYRRGAADGGSIDWSDVDDAHEAARVALGLGE